MSLTPHQIGLAMFRRIGLLSFDPAQNAVNQNRRGLCAGDTDEALIALNGAMEECFALGPVELSEQRQASVLHAATGITLDVSANSTTVANVTTWAAWMQGCTVRIPGDTGDNEFISQTALLRPFMGSTGTGLSSTVYGDAVPLDQSISRVMGPVRIPQQMELAGVEYPFGFDQATAAGFRSSQDFVNFSMTQKPIGQPRFWAMETRNIATNAFTQRFLRVTPIPDHAYSLTYRVKVKPPTYVLSDFYAGTSYGVDPGTIIPFDWAESTLLPIALARFAMHPAFDPAQAATVAQQAETAKRVFREAAKPASMPQRARYAWRV